MSACREVSNVHPTFSTPVYNEGPLYNWECQETGIYPDMLRQGGPQITEDSPGRMLACGRRQFWVHRAVQSQHSTYLCCKAQKGIAVCTDACTFSVRPTLEITRSLLRCSQHTCIYPGASAAYLSPAGAIRQLLLTLSIPVCPTHPLSSTHWQSIVLPWTQRFHLRPPALLSLCEEFSSRWPQDHLLWHAFLTDILPHARPSHFFPCSGSPSHTSASRRLSSALSRYPVDIC